MQLIEAITIYLAAGASFGVYNFLREQNHGRFLHTLLKATRATIFWPLAAAKILFSRQRLDQMKADAEAERANVRFVKQIEQARHDLLDAHHRLIELAQNSFGWQRAKMETKSRAGREIIEKYVELTLAATKSNPDAPPSERELELCRIAGRRGDDLLLAGRCIHRRNAARLILHQARARTALLQALAEIREIYGEAMTITNIAAARHLSVAVLRIYGHAFNLLSLLEDENAARSVARLLDAECARLRRLETLSLKETGITEEELCTTHAPHTVFNSPSQASALNQG